MATEKNERTGTWSTVKCPSGREVEIRKMKLKDEDIITNPSLARNGENISRLLESCTNLSGKELEDTLLGDRVFMLIELRKMRDPIYYPRINCESCKTSWEPEINLSELRVQALNTDAVGEDYSFDVELPSGIKMVGRLLTGKDERQLARVRRQNPDHIMTHLMMLRTKSIEGVDRKTLAWFLELESDDALHFRAEYERHDCGYDTAMIVSCPSCGEEFEAELPFDQTFFLGNPKRRR